MLAPTHRTALLLGQELKSHFLNDSVWDIFTEWINTRTWKECSTSFSRQVPGASKTLQAKAERLHFICNSKYATCDLGSYPHAPKESQGFVDNFWEDIPSISIDVFEGAAFLYTLYLDACPCFTTIGGVKVRVYSLQTSLKNHRMLIVPQLWPGIFLQVPGCFHSQEHPTCRFTLHTDNRSQVVNTIQITKSTANVLDAVLGAPCLYSNITKVLSLYLYYCSHQTSHKDERALAVDTTSYTSGPGTRNPTCFKLREAPNLAGSHKHSSPKEHVRQAHVRHYANGKVVVVSSCIVNKGHTSYFSSQPSDIQK